MAKMTPPPSLALLSSKVKMTPQSSHCQLQNVITVMTMTVTRLTLTTEAMTTQASLNDNGEEECSLLHYLFAPPGSNDDEDGQPSASNLDAAAPDNPYEHTKDAEMSFTWTPLRRRC
jgi:hypothetical protein